MDNLSDLKSNFNESVAQAQQAIGNNLFAFLGQSLQTKAQDAGLQLKTQFVAKADQPAVEASASKAVMSMSPMLLIGGAIVLAVVLLKSKKA